MFGFQEMFGFGVAAYGGHRFLSMFVVASFPTGGWREVSLPEKVLGDFFMAIPFIYEAHIDVYTRLCSQSVAFILKVAFFNCRSPLRYDSLVQLVG